jgi:SAM-dependent methyltransferase
MDSQYVSASEIAAGDLEDLQTCELCGSTALGHELAVGQWTLKRCRSCNIVFTSPRLNEVALNRHYKQGYYEGTAQYFSSQSTPVTADQRALVREVSRLIKSVTPSSLDIGCGGGQLVEAFADAGFSATGTEPSEAACDAAARLGRNVRNADLDSFANESFDCVTAMHVLEHVSHPRPFLAEVARITKLNGIVVIEVPNYGCKTSRRLGAKWVPLYPDTHLFHYTPETLKNALRDHGLVPIRVRRLGGLGLLAKHGAAVQPTASSHAITGKGGPVTSARKSWKSLLWGLRTPLLRVPGVRPLLRWIIWEGLGHGEYVRVIAQKLR